MCGWSCSPDGRHRTRTPQSASFHSDLYGMAEVHFLNKTACMWPLVQLRIKALIGPCCNQLASFAPMEPEQLHCHETGSACMIGVVGRR